MSNPLKGSDLYQDDGSIKQAIKDLEDLRKTYVDSLDDITKEAKELYDELGKVNTATKEGQELAKKSAKDADNLRKAQLDYATALNETNTKIRILKQAKSNDLKVQKLQIKAAQSAKGSYNQLSAQYSLTKLKLNAMSKAEREATKSGRALEKQAKDLYSEMNRLQKATGKHQLQVGKYPKIMPSIKKAFVGLVGTFGLLEGIRLFKDVFRDLNQLKREAKGIEFAFKQIENGQLILEKTREATKGVLSDLDIKKSANEFKNFNLDVAQLPDLLEFVAVRAAQTGKSFEGLRDSLIEGLSKESLRRLDNLGISMIDMRKEMEKTGASVVEAFTKIAGREVQKAGGILKEAANAQAEFNANLENFKVLKADGFISTASNAMYKFGSNILRALTPKRDLIKEIRAEQVGLNALVNQITDVNIENEDRVRLIGKLRKDYPFFLKLIKEEKTDNQSLSTAMQEVNQLYIKRIALQTQQTKIEELLQKSGDRAYNNAVKKVKIDSELSRINRGLKTPIDLTNKSFEERVKLIKAELAVNAETKKQGSKNIMNAQARELAKLNAIYTQYVGGLGNAKNLAKDTAEEQKLLKQVEEEMGTTLAQLNKMFGVNTKLVKSNKDATVELTDAQKKALALEKQRLQLALMPEGREKELQVLSNDYEVKKALAKKHGIDLALVTEWERTQRAAINKKWDDKEVADAKAKEDKIAAAKRKKFSTGSTNIDQQFDLAMSEIDLLKATEAEKTRLRLEAEKKRLRAIIDLNKKIGGQLSDLQIKQMENVIKKIDQQIAKTGESKDIYDLVGLKLDDEQKAAISESVSFAIENVKAMFAARVEAADAMLQKAQEETDAAQSRYDQEIEARNNGYANNVLNAQRELELKKRQEAAALKEKKKAQKAQEALDTAMQVSGLITSSVQIWKSLSGIPIVGTALAVAAVGTMWASYAASKIKAKSAAKEKFGEGGLEFLRGGSHASGNDIPIGTTNGGRQRTAEGGEAMAIIKKSSTKKYKSILPSLITSLNKGTFEQTYANTFIPAEQMPTIVNAGYDSVDLQKVEQELGAIRQQGEKREYIDEQGRLVKIYKNIKTIYV